MLPLRTLALVATSVAALSACSEADGGGGATFSSDGFVSIVGVSKSQVLAADGAQPGDDCQGAGTLGAFDEGAEVVVLDAEGAKVAVGELAAGTLPDNAPDLEQLGILACDLAFTVTDIPEGDGGLFTIQIGESETTVSPDEASGVEISIAGDEYP